MSVDFAPYSRARLWGEGERALLSESGRRAIFQKMNERMLAALRQHHGQRSMAVPSRIVKPEPIVPVLPPVPVPSLPVAMSEKAAIPLSVGLLDDLDEAELVQIRSILRRDSVKRVVDEISEQTGIPSVRIVSTSRNKEVVAARHRAFYELQCAGFSLTQLGRMFKIDHTTALHGIRKHKARNGIGVPA